MIRLDLLLVDGENARTRWLASTGYCFVKLSNGTIVGEHRIICERHHGPIPDGWYVHHIDGCRTNNVSSNLEALPWPEHKCVHEGHWQDREGRWWKRCRRCDGAFPEEDFPRKRYVNGVRKARANCRICERDRQRAQKGWSGGESTLFGSHHGPNGA